MHSPSSSALPAISSNWRGFRLLQIAICLGGLLSASQATPVDWGTTLDASLIPHSSSVTYRNVNGEGYDIVVTTDHLFDQGPGAVGGLMPSTSSWWFQGYVGNPGSSGTVMFRFFKTGTTTPIGINGVNFRLEDAEQWERFANFAYWDTLGNLQPALTNIDPAFSGPLGLTTSLPSNILENATAYEGQTQLGKALEVDLSSTTISGFIFDVFRTRDRAGSVEMTGLGDLSVAVPDTGSTLALLGCALGLLIWFRQKVSA